jgi:predicted RNase H-like HicB family nuclease
MPCPTEEELLQEAKAAIDLWSEKRMNLGATLEDLQREMEAYCEVSRLKVMTGAVPGTA